MKVEASKFFEDILRPCYNKMREEAGEASANRLWIQALFDFGTQSNFS
jgi:hypothetical protein